MENSRNYAPSSRLPCTFDAMLYEGEHALLAQLDRVAGFEPVGREFESLRARHI
jgi:hypothetical protein